MQTLHKLQPTRQLQPRLSRTAGPTLLLQNGFVRAELSLTPPVGISDLRGDLTGRGQYGRPALAAPFRLESFAAAHSGAHSAAPGEIAITPAHAPSSVIRRSVAKYSMK